MKIDPHMTIGKIIENNIASRRSGTANTFEDLLKKLEPETPSKVSTGNLPGVQQGLNPQKIRNISITEQALDLLQKYADMLSTPGITLKDLSSVVDDMNTIKTSLQKVESSLASDDALKGIARDILSTIDSEIIKYTRGDLTA